MRILCMVFGLFCAAATPVAADVDEGLYDPVAPPGSAFVRFLNASGEETPLATKAKSKTYDEIGHMAVTPYFVVPKGDATLAIGSQSAEQAIEEGGFYTAALTQGDKLVVIKDAPNENRAKATVALYNFGSENALSLKAKEGKIAVVEEVSLNAQGSRDLNPLKIDFSVHQGDQELAIMEPAVLERGMAYSVIYAGDKAVLITGRTDTRR